MRHVRVMHGITDTTEIAGLTRTVEKNSSKTAKLT